MDKKERALIITIIANVFLIGLRLYLADVSGSIGLRANALHSITDVFVSGVVLAGLFITRLGKHRLQGAVAKIEHLLAIFVAIFIVIMGIELVEHALHGEGIEIAHAPFVAGGAFVGVVINYLLAAYKIKLGKQTGSSSLVAEGYHTKMDMYCSVAVLVGIIGAAVGFERLNLVASVVAMCFLFYAGFELLWDNTRALFRHGKGSDCDLGHPHHHHTGKLKDH